MKSVEKRNKFD